jgi:DNA-binding CsgD family transcriptional regulator
MAGLSVLEERNQLAAEIHDALAQSFTGISMQLGVAGEQLAVKQGDPFSQIQRANEIAKFGLAQARRSILSLQSSAIANLCCSLKSLPSSRNPMARPELSERELYVLQSMALGRSNKEIGQVLYISENTVKGHVNSILTPCLVRVATISSPIAEAFSFKIRLQSAEGKCLGNNEWSKQGLLDNRCVRYDPHSVQRFQTINLLPL